MAGFNEKSLVEDFIIGRLTKKVDGGPGGRPDLVAEPRAA
jgi:hypothetical protein